MFIEFNSATNPGRKVSFGLLHISYVARTEGGSTPSTTIAMNSGAFVYVKESYEEVMEQIRSQCK